MVPEETVRQVIWNLDHEQHQDAMVGMNDYAQWVSRGGYPADGELLSSLDTATQSWADRWDNDNDWVTGDDGLVGW